MFTMAQIIETRIQFLDLRLHLRLEIYKFAGITRPWPIDLGKEAFRHRYAEID